MSNPGDESRLLVLEKISTIMDCFSTVRPELTLAEIRVASRLPSSTCQRLVQQLVREGMLDRDGDDYRVGLKVVRWALPATEGLDIVRVTRTVLLDLRDATQETAVLFLRDRQYRTVVGMARAHHAVVRAISVGMVAPLRELGSSSRVFMAFDQEALDEAVRDGLRRSSELDCELADIRDRGWVDTFAERETLSAGVAAPVLDRFGALAAVIGIAGPTSRMEDTAVRERNSRAVMHAAREASSRLGWTPEGAGSE